MKTTDFRFKGYVLTIRDAFAGQVAQAALDLRRRKKIGIKDDSSLEYNFELLVAVAMLQLPELRKPDGTLARIDEKEGFLKTESVKAKNPDGTPKVNAETGEPVIESIVGFISEKARALQADEAGDVEEETKNS